jgi:cardiolipin synthase
MVESDAPSGDYCDPPPFSVEAQGLSLNFYPGGRERFDALIGLIAGADTCLKLVFYIFATDESGERCATRWSRPRAAGSTCA